MEFDLIHSPHEQGSPEWKAERMGIITASNFRLARETVIDVPSKQPKLDKKTGEVIEPGREETRKPSSRAMLYAQNTARERLGGSTVSTYENGAMRLGKEYEPGLIFGYECMTETLVDRTGFIYTADRRFGVSPDGLVGNDGMVEVKSLIGSDTLFTVLVQRDYSEFMDQILGGMWLLNRQWCDLILGAPDLSEKPFVVRIMRDEWAISELAFDLQKFDSLVTNLETALRRRIEEH